MRIKLFSAVAQRPGTKIEIDDKNILDRCGQALNIAIIDGQTGEIKHFGTYNTRDDSDAGQRAQIFITESVEIGDFVAVVLYDEAVQKISPTTRAFFKQLGSEKIANLHVRQPWAFFSKIEAVTPTTVKGMPIIDASSHTHWEMGTEAEVSFTPKPPAPGTLKINLNSCGGKTLSDQSRSIKINSKEILSWYFGEGYFLNIAILDQYTGEPVPAPYCTNLGTQAEKWIRDYAEPGDFIVISAWGNFLGDLAIVQASTKVFFKQLGAMKEIDKLATTDNRPWLFCCKINPDGRTGTKIYEKIGDPNTAINANITVSLSNSMPLLAAPQGVKSINIKLLSCGGKEDPARQASNHQIEIEKKSIIEAKQGLNIAIINGNTGEPRITATYNILPSDPMASKGIENFINQNALLQDFIAIVVWDQVSAYHLQPSTKALLNRLGSTAIDKFSHNKPYQPWVFCCQVIRRRKDVLFGKVVLDQNGIVLDQIGEPSSTLQREAKLIIPKSTADAQIEAEIVARKLAEELARQEEIRRMTEATNNAITQLNNTVQQRRLLLSNVHTEIADALDLLAELDVNVNSVELVNLRTALNTINQQSLL